MRASNTAELVFNDCHVPEENRLGDEGASLIHMMRNLQIERPDFSCHELGYCPAGSGNHESICSGKGGLWEKISAFGQIQSYIANSYAEYQACRSYIYNTARQMALNRADLRVDSDGTKAHHRHFG